MTINKLLASNQKRLAPWLWLATCVSLAVLPASGVAAASNKPSLTVAAQSKSAGQIRALVAGALAKVAYLREQTRHGKDSLSKDYLVQLNILFDLIEAARPTGEIDALLDFYQQHLAFEDNKQALADVLPLYNALKALPHSKQVETAQQHLTQARTALQNGKRAEALKSLDNMQRALAIDGVDFPLQAAEEKLQKISNFYAMHNTMPQDGTLLELETDLLQILASLS